jgi:hypothetical protein
MPVVGIGAVLYGRYVKRLSKQAQAALGDAVNKPQSRRAQLLTDRSPRTLARLLAPVR